MLSFLELLDVHKDIDTLFAEHQYALLHFDFDLATARLKEYEAKLLTHMNDEEELLLPLYHERSVIKKGGELKLFLDEHEKMRGYVNLFLETVTSLALEARPEPLLLKLLDREFFFLKLCSHHDIREERFLYPALDEATTDEERSEIFQKLGAQVHGAENHR
jgi:hemerythrin-like domain-containing protein